MLDKAYFFLIMAGLAIVVASTVHYLVIRNRDRTAEVQELVDTLKAREQGSVEPLPEHGVLYRGTLSGALSLAFICDSIVSFVAGTFALRGVAERSVMDMLAAGGVQYAVTQMRRDRTPLTWPNSPWLALAVAGALGLPVSILLSYAPDWRWLLERSDTPWYPATTLHRQDRPGDWDSALQKAVALIRAMPPRAQDPGA